MFDWDDLRAFLAIHRAGTLAGAGRDMKVDATTIGRRVTALEEALGAKLFVRRRDGWVLTGAGARMLPAAERAEEAALDVARAVADAEEEPAGLVRVTTIEIIARRMVAPHLPELLARHPKLQVQLISTTRLMDLTRGQADVALRVGRPTEPELVARRLATTRERIYASRSFCARHGIDPDTHAELGDLPVARLVAREPWLDEAPTEPRVVFMANSVSALVQVVRNDGGLAQLPEILADGYQELVPLPCIAEPREIPLWLVLHQDLARVARVRAVVDHLVAKLAG